MMRRLPTAQSDCLMEVWWKVRVNPWFQMRNHGFILLRDDDAEGGGILFLVLMQGEAATAYSHDLSGE